MFDTLGNKLTAVFDKLKGFGRLNETHIEQALRDVRLALLEADVHVGVVREFTEKVKSRCLGQSISESLTPQQLFLRTVHEELVAQLGGQVKPLILKGKAPHVVMMVGLQGSGKTTTTAKLARYFKQKGRNPYLVPADVQRPAAIEQLKTLARSLELPVFDTHVGDKPIKVAKKGLDEARDRFCDVVFIDTAGRLHIDDDLMDELAKMHKKLDAPQVLLVVDAMTGQEAVRVAKSFQERLPLEGLILTKLDGDAKGGAALSIQAVSGAPLYFVGTGEKTDDLEPFDPQRMVSRLLDRGDLWTLVEKAQEVVTLSDAADLKKKLKQNKFTIEDFRKQLGQVKKLGSMKSLVGMLPGGRAALEKVDMNMAEKEMVKKEAIINSMTFQERTNPSLINGSRRLRIAVGSGTQVSDVNRFLKEFAQMQQMMKNMGRMGGFKKLLGM